MNRALLVGGLSSLHDPLCSAALRGAGVPAVTLPAPTDSGLRLARSLGHHGQCNPPHYAVGAVLEKATASGPGFAQQHQWLTIGSCGPCRLAAFGLEYRRVLSGAGLGDLPILALDQLSFVEGTGPLRSDALGALETAIIAGDLLASLGHSWRPYAEDPDHVDELLLSTVDLLAEDLERGVGVERGLKSLRERGDRLRLDRGRMLPRVLLVGEPWTTLIDGDPSYDLARRLERSGAVVDCPRAIDWLRYRIHEELHDLRSGRTLPGNTARRDALQSADQTLQEQWTHLAAVAGADLPPLEEAAEILALAAPHYPEELRGGSGALETGRALRAVRNGRVHLVLSLKPFGCLPSSSISDGVLSVLLRREGVRFLVVETTGSADANVESRVEMAMHAATLAALDEAAQ